MQGAASARAAAPSPTAPAATAPTASAATPTATTPARRATSTASAAPARTSRRAARTRSRRRPASRTPLQPRFCDGNGVCTNAPKPTGKRLHGERPVREPSFCIDGVCCNQACNHDLLHLQQRHEPGGAALPIAAGLQDHSATTTCDAASSTAASGTCRSNKKPNGQTCTDGTDCGSGFCVDGYLLQQRVHGDLPGLQRDRQARELREPARRLGRTTPPPSPARLPQYCDAAGTCQTGLKANGSTCTAGTECGSGNCVDGVCCDSACSGTCYACNNPGSEGTCGPIAARRHRPDGRDGVHVAELLHQRRTCTTGKKPNGAVVRARQRVRLELLRRRHLLRERVHRHLPQLQERDGQLHARGDGDRPAQELRRAATAAAPATAQGGCAFPPQGKVCGTAGCASDGVIHQPGTCDGAGNCAGDVYDSCNGFRCFTRSGRQHGQVQDQLPDRSQLRDRVLLRRRDGGTCGRGVACRAIGSRPARGTRSASATALRDRDRRSSDRPLLQPRLRHLRELQLPGKEGTCMPDARRHRSQPRLHRQRERSVGHVRRHVQRPRALPVTRRSGTTCGTCKACDGAGLCNVMPDDDTTCGVIDCDGLDTTCIDYHDLTTKRCASVGTCKAPNTAATCTDVTNRARPTAAARARAAAGPAVRRGAGGTRRPAPPTAARAAPARPTARRTAAGRRAAAAAAAATLGGRGSADGARPGCCCSRAW